MFTKQEVGYQASRGEQACGNCKHFEMPAKCKMVEGEISEDGYCELYESGLEELQNMMFTGGGLGAGPQQY